MNDSMRNYAINVLNGALALSPSPSNATVMDAPSDGSVHPLVDAFLAYITSKAAENGKGPIKFSITRKSWQERQRTLDPVEDANLQPRDRYDIAVSLT